MSPDAQAVATWGRYGPTGSWNHTTSGTCTLSDLGVHLLRLHALTQRCGRGSTFVDLGVAHGVSSLALALDAIDRDHDVYGVDLRFADLGFDLRAHPRYHRIRGDSVTVGSRWDRGGIDLLVLDTLHVEPQVLCELHRWVPHVRPGGYVVVHDTAWPPGSHDLAWHAGAAAAGTVWPTPDRAVARFFGLEEHFAHATHTGFHHVDDDLEVTHHPDSWGMTVVRVGGTRDYRANIADWDAVFAQRAAVLHTLFDEATLRWYGVDLAPPGDVGVPP
ncbi:MAG: class I SAM-dependent methyltransferase [Acidimicrobiales bacterium]|nr:class I SAM-dependent methyltransferase [Acidimicrobiales bacterium]